VGGVGKCPTILEVPTCISCTIFCNAQGRFTLVEYGRLYSHRRILRHKRYEFLRAAAGKTKWERVRNVTIREELKQKPLVEQIKKKRATMVRTCNKDGRGEETKADIRS
jgi:Na+-translocating ferredoxin:NAD+ oxidoreductase RnfC subunit